MKYSIDWLKKEIKKGITFDYIYFFGHTKDSYEVITKIYFSQWFPLGFSENGVHYNTAEHYMMAKKATLFGDTEALAKILAADTPNVAKELGRKVKNFDATIWEKNASAYVTQGNFLKFSQYDNLKEFLISTGNSIIVEASPYDKIWGIGLAQHDNASLNPDTWKGTNLLGFAIMEARDMMLESNK